MGNHNTTKSSGLLKKIVGTVLVVVIIAAVIGLNVYNYVTDTGVFARRTVAVSSDNYSYNTAQMSYYFYSQYQNFYSMYASYGLTSIIDTSKSLRAQKCTFGSDNETWYDYFMTQAVEVASKELALCEAAKEEGIVLEDKDYEEVEKTMKNLEETAKKQGYSLKQFLKVNYGNFVTVSDMKSAVELEVLASKYVKNHLDKVDVSDEALQTAYEKDKDKYDTVDFLYYVFNYEDIIKADEEAAKEESKETTSSKETEAEKEVDPAVKAAAEAEAKEYADRLLAEGKDEESYKKVVKDYLMNALHMTEKEADKKLESKPYISEGVTYVSSDETLEWAFKANVGDTKLFEEVEQHDHDEKDEADDHSKLSNIYTVMTLTKARGRDESISYRDVRHILFTKDTYKDKTKAQEVYDKWVADGAKLDDFKALVTKYSEDPGSVENGGLYEGVTEGQMVEEFEEWLFAEDRKGGDYGLVESSSYGWHIMYYEGGVEGWKGQIENDLKTEAQTELTEEAIDNYDVDVDGDALNKISA